MSLQNVRLDEIQEVAADNISTNNLTDDFTRKLENIDLNSSLEKQPINDQMASSSLGFELQCGTQPEFKAQRQFGWFGFTPRWIQWMHRPIFLFFTLATATFAYHMGTGGIFNAVVGTLVRRYELSYTQIGVLATSMNVLSIIFIIIASHYGENGHKGKWLGWSFILYAIGAFVFTLPQWISPIPFSIEENKGSNSGLNRKEDFGDNLNSTIVELCDSQRLSSNADDIDATIKLATVSAGKRVLTTNWANIYFWLFLGARLVQTIAASTTPLKLTYLDENVEQKNSAIFTTLLFLVLMASTGIGMVVGGLTLKFHADSYRADVSEISLGDKDWYGAWWTGYIFVGVLCLMAAIPMFGFAQDLPGKAAKRHSDVDQTHRGGMKKVAYGKSWSDFPRSLAIIFQNPVFTLLAIRNGVLISVIVSMNIFMAVYLREAFGIDDSMGSIVVALCWLLPGMAGSIVGAAMIKYFSMKVREILIMAGVTTVISKILFLTILYHCPTQKVAGVNTGYGNYELQWENLGAGMKLNSNLLSAQTDLSASGDACNANCRCSSDRIRPVCDLASGVLYSSPCLAGCDMQMSNNTFANCKCLKNQIDGALVEGRCPMNDNCKSRKYLFLIFTVLASFSGGMGGTPSFQAGLRSVPFEKRTLAMGIQSIAIKLLMIPGPIIMGSLMDRSCLVKMPKIGANKNTCFQYDASAIGQNFAIFTVIAGIIATVLIVIAILLYSPPGGEPWYKYWRRFGKKSGVAALGADDENPPLKAFDNISTKGNHSWDKS